LTSKKKYTIIKKKKEEVKMGMTDKQFDSYIRILLAALREAHGEEEPAKTKERLTRIIDDLQKTLED
jgi:molecular chaperone DnaK (HSP70)